MRCSLSKSKFPEKVSTKWDLPHLLVRNVKLLIFAFTFEPKTWSWGTIRFTFSACNHFPSSPSWFWLIIETLESLISNLELSLNGGLLGFLGLPSSNLLINLLKLSIESPL